MRPRIGITSSYKDNVQRIDYHYIQAIEAAGGLPLIVPILESEEAAQEFTALLDGLVMTGGPGITRGLVGDLPEDLEPVDSLRDKSDERIFRAMLERPFLGICYGMQFANAMHGGTIYADVSAQAKSQNHSAGRGAEAHFINIAADTSLYRILNTPKINVNTYHIQAVAELGEGLKVAAKAADGVIEGIESLDGRVIGVQFHPERMGEAMMPLFRDFVARCKQ